MEKLIIKVDQIEEPRQPWKHALSKALLAEVFAELPTWTVKAPADFTAYVTKVGDTDVLVEGKTVLSLESSCRRCLRDVPSELPISFTLTYVARPPPPKRRGRRDEDDGESPKSASFEENELDEEYYDGEVIDLSKGLREQLLLGLPTLEPLCREACKGLCTTCGQDLNEKDCGHSQKVLDPRLAVLRDIKL